MTQITSNTFTDGLMTDLNPLNTPKTVLTDCLNGTIITYNGNEFTLQNDLGNVKMNNIHFPSGYVPVGMKEYGGIVYVALYSPSTEECQIGSFPSPQTIEYGTDQNGSIIASFNSNEIIDQTSHNTKTVLKPLFNMVDKLNPGDRYKITKTILSGNTELFDENVIIDGEEKVNPNRIFKTKFFYQTEDNKIVQIQNSDITFNGDLESTYFKGTSGAVFAISYEIENLEYFNVNINALTNDSIEIRAKGSHDTLKLFKGFKLDAIQNEETITSYYKLSDNEYNKEILLNITGINTKYNIDLSLTPFSDYSYFKDMTVRRSFTPTQLATISTSLNYVYKYYIDNDNLKIDFNFKYDTKNLDLFVELYDPVSDCSTVKKVDDPSPYGINTVLFDLVDEPVTRVNDSTDRYGVPYSKLSKKMLKNIEQYDADDYLKEKYKAEIPKGTVKSGDMYPSIYIRNNSELRKNHFYILKISYVEKNTNTETNVLKPYLYKYFFKSLYTSDLFNQYYNTIDDYEDININMSDVVSFNYSLSSDSITKNINNYGYDQSTLDLMTDGKSYKISKTQLPENYFHYNEYLINRDIGIKITYDSTNMFGTFNEELITTDETNTIVSTLSANDSFDAVSKIGSTEVSTNREKGISINQISDSKKPDKFNYLFTFGYNSYRNTSVQKNEISGQQIDYYTSIPLNSCLAIKSNIQPDALINLTKPDYTYFPDESVASLQHGYCWYLKNTYSSVYDGNNYGYYKHFNKSIDDNLQGLLTEISTTFAGQQNPNKFSAMIVTINTQNCWAIGDFSEGTTDSSQYFIKDSSPYSTPWKKTLLVIRQGDDSVRSNFLRIHNTDDIKEFFNNTFICSIESGQYYTYCPNMNTLKKISNGSTIFKQNLKIKASISGNTNDALFKFYKFGDTNPSDFNSSTISGIISSLTTGNNSWIGNDKVKQIGDNPNVYPLLKSTYTQTLNIEIPDYQITKSSDPVSNNITIDIQNQLSIGQSQLANAINITPPTTHGKLFTSKTLKLSKLIDSITVMDMNGNEFGVNTPVTSSNFRIQYKARNTGYGDVGHRLKWKDGTGDTHDAPNMNDDYLY